MINQVNNFERFNNLGRTEISGVDNPKLDLSELFVKYKGKLVEGRPHGKGVLFYQDNTPRYIGEFKNGFFHGKGTLYPKDGRVSSGRFENHLPVEEDDEGRETVSISDYSDDNDPELNLVQSYPIHRGDELMVFYGVLSNGIPDVFGMFCTMYGLSVYEGGLKDGVPHGKGTFYDLEGKINYEGDFYHSKKHGQGKLYLPDGRVKFEGEFEDGKMRHGKKYEDSGCYYEGDFSTGKLEGEGAFYSAQGLLIRKGNYKKGEYQKGVEYLTNGAKIEATVIKNQERVEYQGKVFSVDDIPIFKGLFCKKKDLIHYINGGCWNSDGKIIYKGGFLSRAEAQNQYDGQGKLFKYDSEGRCTEYKVVHEKGELISEKIIIRQAESEQVEVKNYDEAKIYLKSVIEASNLGSIEFNPQEGKGKKHTVIFKFASIKKRDELFKLFKQSAERNKKGKVIELKQNGGKGEFRITVSFANSNNFVSLFDMTLLFEINRILGDTQVNSAPNSSTEQKTSATTSSHTTKKVNVNKAEWKNAVQQYLSMGGEVSEVSEQNRIIINYSSLFITGESGRREYPLKISKSSSRKDDSTKVSVSADQLKNILTRFKNIQGIKIIENKNFANNPVFELEFTDEKPNIEELKKAQDAIAKNLIGSPAEQVGENQAVKTKNQPEKKVAFSSAAAAARASVSDQAELNPYQSFLNTLNKVTGTDALNGHLKPLVEKKDRHLEIRYNLKGGSKVSIDDKLISAESLLRYTADIINCHIDSDKDFIQIFNEEDGSLKIVVQINDFKKASYAIDQALGSIKSSVEGWVSEQTTNSNFDVDTRGNPTAIRESSTTATSSSPKKRAVRDRFSYLTRKKISSFYGDNQPQTLNRRTSSNIHSFKSLLDTCKVESQSYRSSQIHLIKIIHTLRSTCSLPADEKLFNQLTTLRTILRHYHYIPELNKDFVNILNALKTIDSRSGNFHSNSDDEQVFDIDQYIDHFQSMVAEKRITKVERANALSEFETIQNSENPFEVVSAACNLWDMVKENGTYKEQQLTPQQCKLIQGVSISIGHEQIEDIELWVTKKFQILKEAFRT